MAAIPIVRDVVEVGCGASAPPKRLCVKLHEVGPYMHLKIGQQRLSAYLLVMSVKPTDPRFGPQGLWDPLGLLSRDRNQGFLNALSENSGHQVGPSRVLSCSLGIGRPGNPGIPKPQPLGVVYFLPERCGIPLDVRVGRYVGVGLDGAARRRRRRGGDAFWRAHPIQKRRRV